MSEKSGFGGDNYKNTEDKFTEEEKKFAENYSRVMEKQTDDFGWGVAKEEDVSDREDDENMQVSEVKIPRDIAEIGFDELKPGKKILLEKISFLEKGVEICEEDDAKKMIEFVKNVYPTSKEIDFSKIFFAYGEMPGGAGAVACPKLTEKGPVSIVCFSKDWREAIESDDFKKLGKSYYEDIENDYKQATGGKLDEDLRTGKDLQHVTQGRIKLLPDKIRTILQNKDFDRLGRDIVTEGINHEVTHGIHQTEPALFKEYGNKLISLDKDISDIRKTASSLLKEKFSESERKALVKEYLKSCGEYQEGYTDEKELTERWPDYVNQRLYSEYIAGRLADKPEREAVFEMKRIWAEAYGLDSNDDRIFNKEWLKNQVSTSKEEFMKNPTRETYKKWFNYSDFCNEILRIDNDRFFHMNTVPHSVQSRLTHDSVGGKEVLKEPLIDDIVKLSKRYFGDMMAERNIGKQHSDFTENVAYITGEREVPEAISNMEAPNYFVYTETAREISKRLMGQVEKFGIKRVVDEVMDVYTPWGIMKKVQKMESV